MRHYETVRVRKDGGLIQVSLTVSPVRDTQGKIIGASTIARDVTERKQTESLTREANQRLKELVKKARANITCEIALLNHLIQLLQTCQSSGEVYAATRQFAELLFPGDSGSVNVLNSSLNLVGDGLRAGKDTPCGGTSVQPSRNVGPCAGVWCTRSGDSKAPLGYRQPI